MKEFKPSIKQYQALMYLGAIPLAEPKNGEWVSVLDEDKKPILDFHTTKVWFGWAAWGGKSHLGCKWLSMMARKLEGTRWFIAREEIKKIKESTLLTMFDVLMDEGLKMWRDYKYNNISGQLTFTNGSVIYLLALDDQPSDPNFTRFGSTEFTWWFIDEANECSYRWFEILTTRLRYKLESFCPYCSWEISNDDKIDEEKYKNPEPTWEDDKFIERNVYLCPNCTRKSPWVPPKILCTFNPDKWWVYNLFYKPYKEERLPKSCKFIPALVTDNPFIPKAYIANLRRLQDKVMKERLLYGNFEYDDTPWRLFEYDELNSIFMRKTEKDLMAERYRTDPKFREEVDVYGKNSKTGYKYKITCDPARHGRDVAVIMVWLGLSVIEVYAYEYSDTTELEERINILRDKYDIWPKETIVDDDWVWGWLVDRLKCVWFINNAKAIQKKGEDDPMKRLNYGSLKDQCYFELSNKISSIAIDLENVYYFAERSWRPLSGEQIKDRIVTELDAMVEVDIDKDWPKKVISKKDIKAKIWRSPDFWDCIMMRMYWEVRVKRKVFVYAS